MFVPRGTNKTWHTDGQRDRLTNEALYINRSMPECEQGQSIGKSQLTFWVLSSTPFSEREGFKKYKNRLRLLARNGFVFKIRVWISIFKRKNNLKIRYLVAEILSKNGVSFSLGHPVYFRCRLNPCQYGL